MSARSENAVARVRALASRGMPEDALLEHVVSSLGRELSPLSFMAVLREAFDIPLLVLRDRAEGWEGLGQPGCLIPTQVVADLNKSSGLPGKAVGPIECPVIRVIVTGGAWIVSQWGRTGTSSSTSFGEVENGRLRQEQLVP